MYLQEEKPPEKKDEKEEEKKEEDKKEEEKKEEEPKPGGKSDYLAWTPYSVAYQYAV